MSQLRTAHPVKAALLLAVTLSLSAGITILAGKQADTHMLRLTARTWQQLRVQQADSLARESSTSLLRFAAQALHSQHETERRRKTILPVRRIAQAPELPQGCECAAAATVLQFLGIDASKTELADRYLVKLSPSVYADPYAAYMGDPRNDGWYCYAPPIANAINRYLTYNALDKNYRAVDITGTSLDTLREHIYEGRPVIIWGTLGFRPPRYSTSFLLSDGTQPYSNLHCLVLVGYSETSYYFADPLCEVYEADRQTVEDIYNEMGRHALLLVTA